MKYLATTPQSSFSIAQCDAPQCQENEVLIAVQASGINRADLLQLAGHYPPPKGASDIIGLEVSGTIAWAPSGCRYNIGDRVMALLPGGGYAQTVAVDVGSVMPLDDSLSFCQGAAIPEAFITAYQVLFDIGRLNDRLANGKKCRVLIHAGASGVGSAAIQLAHRVGCEVYTTASSDDKLDAIAGLGVTHGINYNQQNFASYIQESTNKAGVDIIIDFIGGDYLNDNVDAVASDGIIVNLAMLGGRYGQQLDFGKLLLKRVTMTGTTLRNRSCEYKARLIREFEYQFLAGFNDKTLTAIVDSQYRYHDVSTAFSHISNNKNIGKLILHSFE